MAGEDVERLHPDDMVPCRRSFLGLLSSSTNNVGPSYVCAGAAWCGVGISITIDIHVDI